MIEIHLTDSRTPSKSIGSPDLFFFIKMNWLLFPMISQAPRLFLRDLETASCMHSLQTFCAVWKDDLEAIQSHLVGHLGATGSQLVGHARAARLAAGGQRSGAGRAAHFRLGFRNMAVGVLRYSNSYTIFFWGKFRKFKLKPSLKRFLKP